MGTGFVGREGALKSRCNQIAVELRRRCWRFLPVLSAQEDVLQQVFVLLLERWGSDFTDQMLSEDTEVETIIRWAIDKAIGQARWTEQKRRQRKLAAMVQDDGQTNHLARPGLDAATVAELRIAFQQMSRVERRLIAMCRQGLSIRTICKRLKIDRRAYDDHIERLERRLTAALIR